MYRLWWSIRPGLPVQKSNGKLLLAFPNWTYGKISTVSDLNVAECGCESPLPENLLCATISQIQYLVFSGLECEIWCWRELYSTDRTSEQLPISILYAWRKLWSWQNVLWVSGNIGRWWIFWCWKSRFIPIGQHHRRCGWLCWNTYCL